MADGSWGDENPSLKRNAEGTSALYPKAPPGSPQKRSWGLIAPLLTLLAGSLLWGGEQILSPDPGQPLAVIFPNVTETSEAGLAPWRAGATQVLAFGFWPGLVLVRSDHPDFVERLYAAGALVVMRAPGKSDFRR